MAYWESSLERDAFRRLDADSSVLAYEEQPAKILYSVDGERLTHYPDILVTWKSSRGFLEVKTDRDADSHEVRERTAIIIPLLRQAGFSYRVWCESEIRIQPILDNEIYLLTFGRRTVPLVERERIRRLFAGMIEIPWQTLTGKLLGANSVQYVARLILEGILIVDRSVPLTPASPVCLAETVGSLS